MTRQLIQFSMIERRDFSRATPDYWYRQLEGAVKVHTGYRRMAEQGSAILNHAQAARRHNLAEMCDVFTFVEREFPALLPRWQEERSNQA